jgi:hypothetical protein
MSTEDLPMSAPKAFGSSGEVHRRSPVELRNSDVEQRR